MSKLRAGVIGAGVFGGYHAGKYAHDPRTTLAAVFDTDAARARALAERWDAAPFTDLAAFLAACDLVSVASPAHAHAEAGLAAVSAGVHALIEKPLAVDPAAGAAIVAAAAEHGAVVQVGHQERFVLRAMGLLDVAARPRRIETWRLNPFHERGADVSVTLDLMTHDLDLVRLLTDRQEPERVTAATASERTEHVDRVEASLAYAGGVEAHLRASRLNAAPERGMRLTYDAGVVTVDFVAKTVDDAAGLGLNPDFADDPSAKDSLGAAVAAFITAALGDAPPAVTGADGLAAVRLAAAVDAAGARALNV